MTIPIDILGFVKSHAADQVLSVFVDCAMTDPAKRHAWRTVLKQGVRRARQQIEETSPDELEAFDRCVANMEGRLPETDAMPGGVGLMYLCAPDGDLVDARLPISPTPLVSWHVGPVLFPYLVATRAEEAVVVMVDLEHATIARLHRAMMHPIESLEAEISFEAGPHMGDPARVGFHRGKQGETGTDTAQRQKREAHDRLVATTTRRLSVVAGHEAPIVVGGAAEASARLLAALPAELASRCVVAESLHMTTPPSEIPAIAHTALLELLTRKQLETVNTLDRRAHLKRNAAFGYDAVAAAAEAGAIEHLLVAESAWQKQPDQMEHVMQQAVRAGALVEIATPECATVLETTGGGLAAELRFAVHADEDAVHAPKAWH